MKCNFCGEQVCISHLCPYCGEHYCLEHRDLEAHNCPSHNNKTITRKPKAKNNLIKAAKLQTRISRAHHRAETNPTIQRQAVEVYSKPKRSEAYIPQVPAKEIIHRKAAYTKTLENFEKRLFAGSFVLVLLEEVLRLASYLTNPPLLAYLDGNIIVRTLSQHLGDPLIASLLVFAVVCFILFMTWRLASPSQSIDNFSKKPFAGATLIIVFTIIAIIYMIAIIGWIFVLTK